MTAYEYETCCINSTADLINEMVGKARQITFKTFFRMVGAYQIKRVFPFYAWGHEFGLKMKDDWAVRYYKSAFNGRRCYYVYHSAIEYIFVEV